MFETIFIILFLFLVAFAIVYLKNRYGKSELTEIISFRDRILLLSKVFHSSGESGEAYQTPRLILINKISGNLSKKVILDGEYTFAGEVNDNLWFMGSEILAINLNSFKIIANQNTIKNAIPELKNEVLLQFKFNEILERIYFITNEGTKYFFDCKNFTVKLGEVNQAEDIIRKDKKKNYELSDFRFYPLEGTELQALVFQKTKLAPYLRFLNPEILKDTATGSEIILTLPISILIYYHDTLDKFSDFKIYRISKEGNILWTISQREIEIQHNLTYERKANIIYTEAYKSFLILGIKAKRDTLLAIDMKKGNYLGSIKYRYVSFAEE